MAMKEFLLKLEYFDVMLYLNDIQITSSAHE